MGQAQGSWDETKVREWSLVFREARQKNEKVHIGRISEICVEKGSELPEGHPERKFKGRVVFQGNNVKDENWDVAMFHELSSAPATMQAAKAADAYGLLAGHAIECADGEQAYIQSKLGGTPTMIRLPKERWPAEWSHMSDPVCPLILSLYSHPDAGGYWEKHCEEKALGKPKNKEEAFNMLKKMSGKQHAVYTSISIKSSFFQKIFHDETIVEFEEFTDEEINYYLEKFSPYDKAGSYGIQDWIGLVGVKKIIGSYFNVMGLPVHKLYKELLKIAQ